MFHGALEDGGLIVTEHTQKMPVELAHLFQSGDAGRSTVQKSEWRRHEDPQDKG